MIQIDYKDLIFGINKIEEGVEQLVLVLDDVLSRSDKSFSIMFKGHTYDFFPATTPEEKEKMRKLRRRFIKSLLRRIVSFNITYDNYGWDDILAFATGPDPKDFQFEKIDVKDLYEITNENGERITSLPLNIDSSYVKAQDIRNDKQDS